MEKISSFVTDISPTVCSAIPGFLSVFTHKDHANEIFSIAQQLISSKSWLVRSSFILHYSKIFIPLFEDLLSDTNKSTDRSKKINDYLSILYTAISDSEGQVRTAAVDQFKIFDIFPETLENYQEIKDEITKYLELLLNDDYVHAKTTAITLIPWSIHYLGYHFSIEKLSTLISDKSREVKLAAIDALKDNRISRDLAFSCLIDLCKSSKEWREKITIPEICPLLISDLSKNSNYEESLKSLTLLVELLLFDDSYDVRMKIIDTIPKIMLLLGKKWVENQFIPILEKEFQEDDYQLRQTVIIAIIKLKLKNPQCCSIIKSALSDTVSNVRLTLAKFSSDPEILKQLVKDSDPDVSEIVNSKYK